MPKIKVVQEPEKEVPTEIVAQAIVDISHGMKKIEDGRLNWEALVLLVSHASGVGKPDVRAVLSGLSELERTYLKPKKVVGNSKK